jgi:hypothetical protein
LRQNASVATMRKLLLTGALLAAVAGCSHPARPAPTQRLAVCVAPSASDPADGRVTIEFRRSGQVIASGSIPVGGVFAAPVPADAAVDAYANDKLVGSKPAGGGDVYLSGAGCPDTPE